MPTLAEAQRLAKVIVGDFLNRAGMKFSYLLIPKSDRSRQGDFYPFLSKITLDLNQAMMLPWEPAMPILGRTSDFGIT